MKSPEKYRIGSSLRSAQLNAGVNNPGPGNY